MSEFSSNTRSGQPQGSPQAIVLLTVPAGAVKPGRYQVTLVGERASRQWPLEVR